MRLLLSTVSLAHTHSLTLSSIFCRLNVAELRVSRRRFVVHLSSLKAVHRVRCYRQHRIPYRWRASCCAYPVILSLLQRLRVTLQLAPPLALSPSYLYRNLIWHANIAQGRGQQQHSSQRKGVCQQWKDCAMLFRLSILSSTSDCNARRSSESNLRQISIFISISIPPFVFFIFSQKWKPCKCFSTFPAVCYLFTTGIFIWPETYTNIC